jgi:hypothetical protein
MPCIIFRWHLRALFLNSELKFKLKLAFIAKQTWYQVSNTLWILLPLVLFWKFIIFDLLAYYLNLSFEITFLNLSQCVKIYGIKFMFVFWPSAAHTWNPQNCGKALKKLTIKDAPSLEMTYFILCDRDTSTDIVTSVPAELVRNRVSICGRGKSVSSSAKRPDSFCAYPSSYSIATDSFSPREWRWPFTSIC